MTLFPTAWRSHPKFIKIYQTTFNTGLDNHLPPTETHLTDQFQISPPKCQRAPTPTSKGPLTITQSAPKIISVTSGHNKSHGDSTRSTIPGQNRKKTGLNEVPILWQRPSMPVTIIPANPYATSILQLSGACTIVTIACLAMGMHVGRHFVA